MAGDDDKPGGVERDPVEIDRPAHLGGHRRPGMADLDAERHAELAAGNVGRVEQAILGRTLPQPGQHADPPDAELVDAA